MTDEAVSSKQEENKLVANTSAGDTNVDVTKKEISQDANTSAVPKPSSGIKKTAAMKLPSLQDIKSGNMQPIVEEVKDEEENLPNNPFDEFDFNQAWELCVNKVMEKNQRSLNAMIQAAKPKVDLENFKANIVFHNKIQHELFLAEKPYFIGLIREKLQNFSFDFDVVVDTKDDELVPYTNSDKFKAMSAKNPALLKLREQFGLDIN